MNLKEIKREAKKNVGNGYFKNLLVVFVSTIILAGGINYSTKNILKIDVSQIDDVGIVNSLNDKSNGEILDELLEKTMEDKKNEEWVADKFSRGVLSVIVNEIVATKSVLFGLLNSLNKFLGGHISVALVILIANFVLFFLKTFFFSVLEVGKNRYFLESRRYLKTNIDRILFPYRKGKNFRLALILFIKNIYIALWSFSIVGFFVKIYEYAMIPYLLAENPNLKRKEAFALSKKLMDGNKLNLFKLDLSALALRLLGLVTFNIFNTFFTNIYVETLHAEFYIRVRNSKKDEQFLKEMKTDEFLYIDDCVDGHYPSENENKTVFNLDYEKSYTLQHYILFFFTFSIVGWLWEVTLHLIQEGSFVNRGTMHGPWLPIYGFGGVLILALLKRFRKSNWQMFLSSVILCALIEYSSAWFLETFKHLKYWDYSGYFLNLHGRICLEGLIVFGLGGCGFTYIFAPFLDNIFEKWNKNFKTWLCIISILIFSVDFFYSTFIQPNSGEGITSIVEAKID